MLSLPSAAVLLVLVTVIYSAISTLWASRYHARKAKELGAARPPMHAYKLPLGVDNLMRFIRADKKHKVPQEAMKVFEEAGRPTYLQRMPGTTNIITHDPKNIQALLATQFHDFELGSRRKGNFYPMLGIGIFTSDGKTWEHSRATLRPQFARDQIADLDLEEKHVQLLFRHLPVDATGWTAPTDLAPIFFRLTIDSATEFLFGESINSQQAALTQDGSLPAAFSNTDVAECFDHGITVLGQRARLARLYWLYNPSSFREAIRVVHRFADYCIERAATTNTTQEKDGRYIFLKELMKITDNKVEIRSQLLNILLAGRDTTAGLLGWTFWELARHPDVFRKLRATIIETFGAYDSSNKKITFAALKSCSYLQYVMNEILRLYPSVPLNSREATKDTTLPRGGGPDGLSPVYVRRGQEVNYSVYVMHRRRDIWGPDADEFKPERWQGRKFGWEYIPFNGGPRVCPGQQFALTEAGYVICRILQRFDGLENGGISNEELHDYGLTTAPVSVRVRLHQAE
ncbi:Cytochrome P450 monooxygenase [Exophiala dermatitidis]